MIEMSDAFVIINACLFLALIATGWRFMNSKGSVSWNVQTTEPEASAIRRSEEEAGAAVNRLQAENGKLRAMNLPKEEP